MSQSSFAWKAPTDRDKTPLKPDASKRNNGRLPKSPSPLLGPLKRFSANYQLNRAQEYHDEGGEYVEEIGNNYPEWKGKEEYAKLVKEGRDVFEYMEDMLDRDSWSVTESRDVKHVARRYRTSALRSSRKAKQERREEGVTYVPDISPTPAEQESAHASLQQSDPGFNPRAVWIESGPPDPIALSGRTLLMQPLDPGPGT
ncbi:hypothetical protein L227DRAFT_582123 [Lentinus tigrinus ALCF2SS1-6]|uniref:Uncharacterized protein n=1 Tax=Lentinus tigrinus ALCF2SS1-6 TaxID=1328759 RepID=A0A5C2RL82_9APHY|nr:hypothetical protein L227DRAFT_582123 [Lentinus tigrinus ALCF2SS1-6]